MIRSDYKEYIVRNPKFWIDFLDDLATLTDYETIRYRSDRCNYHIFDVQLVSGTILKFKHANYIKYDTK